MIIYGLLKLVMVILDLIAGIFGSLLPGFPDLILDILDTISTMVAGGVAFVSYFFSVPVLVALLSLVIAWYGFSIVKDALMKVIGHFIGN